MHAQVWSGSFVDYLLDEFLYAVAVDCHSQVIYIDVYGSMNFRAHEFPWSNPVPGLGDSVPHHATHTVTAIDTDISCNIFDGAFRAPALMAGLLAPAPISDSEPGCNAAIVSDTLLVAPGAPGSVVLSKST